MDKRFGDMRDRLVAQVTMRHCVTGVSLKPGLDELAGNLTGM